MANVTGASLEPIYNRLNGAPTYHPFEANTFADPSIEAGDVVRVSRDGVNYDSPVHSTRMTWKKFTQVQLSSTGNEKRETVSRVSQRKYRGGSSGLRNTRYQHIYVEDAYNQMRSGLELTTSTAHLYVQDAYNQMKSGLELTSSSAHVYVEDAYNQMRSGLELTSSSAHAYVQDAYRRMQAGLQLTSSSAALYVNSRTSSAYIIAQINARGESEACIEADNVYISGTTTINDSFEVTSTGYLNIKKTMYCSGNVVLSAENTYFSGDQFSGKELEIKQAGNVLNKYTVNYSTLGSMVKTVSVANGQVTLTRFDGTYESFRKAASSLSGDWSSNGKFPLTVSDGVNDYDVGIGGATYNAHDIELELVANGTATKDTIAPSSISVPVAVKQLNQNSDSTERYSKNLTVSILTLLESKTATSNGEVTPGSDKIGLSKVTVDITPDDADVESAASNAEKSVRVRSKCGSKYSSYKTLPMSTSTYTPQNQTSEHDCVVVKDGSTVVGRYDIQTYGNTKYSSGKTEGESIGINGVHHIVLDYNYGNGGAHNNNWWNCHVYNSGEGKHVYIQTDQRSTGIYIPIVMEKEFTANGTYYPWNYIAEGGGNGTVFGPIKVNVPTGGGSSRTYISNFYCTIIYNSNGTRTLRCEHTFSATENIPFSNGTYHDLYY